MLKFEPNDRAYLSEIRALSTDQDDNEIFVGMTVSESVWYANYVQESFNGTVTRDDAAQDRYISLHTQHEEMRRTILAAESLAWPSNTALS